MTEILRHIKRNWMIVAIVILATFLRTWQLDTLAPFFSDSGRDVLVAAEAVKNRQLPLLGIPSSVPEFRQGPLAIWLTMAVIAMVGENVFAMQLVFAVVGVAAVIAVYELVTIYFSRWQGILAAGLIAVSPLAIAQSRMVYHTNPIPLAIAGFIWMLTRLWQNKPRALFWAVLAWAIAFQFELALLPLVLLVPYVLWRQRRRLTKDMVAEGIGGLVLGLLPQIVYDLTHQFSQLGAFGYFVGRRLVTTFIPGTDHAFGGLHIQQTLDAFWVYGGRIVSTDQLVVKLAMLLLLVVCGWLAYQAWQKRKLSPVLEITWVATIVTASGYLLYGSQSEAYFPVFIPLIAIIVAGGVGQLSKTARQIAVVMLILIGVANCIGILQHSFFVSTIHAFSYGPSSGEQQEVVALIKARAGDHITLRTTDPAADFASYFDNYRWWMRQAGMTESETGTLVFIEQKDSQLRGYPDITRVAFPSVDVYFYE